MDASICMWLLPLDIIGNIQGITGIVIIMPALNDITVATGGRMIGIEEIFEGRVIAEVVEETVVIVEGADKK